MKPKPKKPYKDFPLFPASNGQWAKSIRGKRYYFGAWDDPDAAIDFYQRVRDDLYAGRSPDSGGFLTLVELVNEFLASKEAQADAGHITVGAWKEYKRTCGRVLSHLDGKLDACKLRPQDFSDLRAGLVLDIKSPKTLQNELTRCKVLFKWAFDSGTIPAPLPFKMSLKPPAARLLRLAKKSRTKVFTAKEIKAIIRVAGSSSSYMKPAIYLGINAGLGNRDVCELRWKNISQGWLDFPRPKTGCDRRAKLWPETIKALEQWRKIAPKSQWVCCGQGGANLVTLEGSTPIAHQFRDLMTEAKIDVGEKGRGFYGLRHTYRTVADGQGDQPAIMLTMGHADNSMSGSYRHHIEDKRLEAVSEWVRKWFGKR